MAERRLVIDRLKLSYEGLFNAAELYNVISSWFFEKGWDWNEKYNKEMVTAQGKQIQILLEPWKSASDYYKLVIHMKITMVDVKEVELKKGNKPVRMDHGVIRMIIDGYVVSDRNNQWTGNTFGWFIALILEKYFYRNHLQRFETWLKGDVEDIHDKIKRYLNMVKYNYGRKKSHN